MKIHQQAKKVRLTDKAIAIISSRQRIESREKKVQSVKIWSKLNGNSKDVDRDCSDESNIEELSDSLRPIEILSMHSCCAMLSFVCFLHTITLVCFVAFISIFVFPILLDQLQETPSYRKVTCAP